MIIALFTFPFVAALLWLFSIRPYCREIGKIYAPSVQPMMIIWIDWQHAKEIAIEKNDQGMKLLCRVFLGLHVIIIGILLYAAIKAST